MVIRITIWMPLRRTGVEGGSGETFLPRAVTCISKSLFHVGLRCSDGVPFRPADLARGDSRPPPEVPREMTLVRKTSRQGYSRQGSTCLPQHVSPPLQAPPQQICVWRHAH